MPLGRTIKATERKDDCMVEALQKAWSGLSRVPCNGVLGVLDRCRSNHLVYASGDIRLMDFGSGDIHCTPEQAMANRRVKEGQERIYLDELKMGEVIGEGGFGVVREAEVMQSYRGLARYGGLKTIAIKMVAGDVFSREEINVLRSVKGHPNIVAFVGVAYSQDRLYIGMERVNGPCLADIQGPMPEWSVLELMMQVGGAVAWIHGKGIAHLDIKPDNIILDQPYGGESFAGGSRLVDFGLARTCPAGKTVDDRWCDTTSGTPGFSSMEAELGPQYAPGCADIFSVGATMFYLLVGWLPFGDTFELMDAATYKDLLDEKYATLRSCGISQATCAVVERCLQRSPHRRPRADEFIQLVQAAHRSL